MVTAVMYVQRWMVVFAIFLCYIHAEGVGDKKKRVNCEDYPFHVLCRGVPAKRTMAINYIRDLDCDETRGDLDCIRLKAIGDKQRYLSYLASPRSKLWLTLLDDNLQKATGYNLYPLRYELRHNKRKDSEMEQQYDERRIPLLESFLSDLDTTDSDY